MKKNEDEIVNLKLKPLNKKPKYKLDKYLFYIIISYIIIIFVISFLLFFIVHKILVLLKKNHMNISAQVLNNSNMILNRLNEKVNHTNEIIGNLEIKNKTNSTKIYNGINTTKNNNEIKSEASLISDMLINISYAQWLEDLILNAFFYDINNGFYIDVGANSPNYLSVTKHFYLKGWNGINIEPLKYDYEQLKKERPRDINIQVCAGEKEGNITLYEDGALTTSHKEYTFKKLNGTIAKLRTLSNICKEYIPKNKVINFCKIDVEGDEKEVLLGFDFENFRPNIFCIECTKPGTMSFTHQNFEDILIKNNYEHIYTYGINRYYVDKNLDYLKERAKFIEKLILSYKRRK